MITLTAESRAWKVTTQYIAQITGRDSKFTFRRQFTGKKTGQSTEAYIDQPGLFEICDIDTKGRKEQTYAVVVTRPASCPPLTEHRDPELMQFWLDVAEAAQLARRLDKGESLDDMIAVSKKPEANEYTYAILAPGAAKRASASASVERAVEHCWEVLQAFPEREAKKVLAALKLRVSPPKPAPPEPSTPAAEEPREPSTPEAAAAPTPVEEA